MNAPKPRPLPDVDDALLAPFWAASRRRVLTVQRCEDCGEVRFPPLPVCPSCWSENQDWVEVEPTGTIWSYVIYHRALSAAFKDDVPYAIGRVVTDAGPSFTVRLDIPLEQLEVGLPVVASFRDVDDRVTLLQFAKR